MKRFFLVLGFWAATLPAIAQAPKTSDFRVATDSLEQRLYRRTGVRSSFKMDRALVRNNYLDLYFSQNFAGFPWRPGDVEWVRDQIEQLAGKYYKGYELGDIFAGRQPLGDLLVPAIGNNGKPLETNYKVADQKGKTVALVRGDDNWPLGMSGRHIALWQSHGFYYKAETDCWLWQRSPNHRTVEDIFTQGYVVPFLMPMLENAGAVVLCPRERDPQPNEVVCDNDAAFGGSRGAGVRRKGDYNENGRWTDAGTGFADAKEIYELGENPFTMGSARKTDCVPEDREDAPSVEWRPDIPEKGRYAVYVSYKTLSNSTTDARYTVHHLGGETLLHVNQKMGGGMWIYLGTFSFDKGTDGYVELSACSSARGVVSADAVRFGGGMGKVARGDGISGKASYFEGALYNLSYSGMDISLFDDWETDYVKDYAGRGRWVQDLAGGSRVNPSMSGRHIPVDLSLAWHSDAGSTPDNRIVGTLAIYTRLNKNKEEFPNGEDRMNSRLLSDLVQSQLVDDIQALYEPIWQRRQLWDRSYSESRTPNVPALLLELHSHLNFADMRYGLDPSFRFTAARAVYKGILKYLSARYGCSYAVQPLPVQDFKVQLKDGKAMLSWKPVNDPLEPTAKPTSYRVYTRVEGKDFGAAGQVSETEISIPLDCGKLYSFKVTACNDGGESFPSEILCAGYPSTYARKVLVVNDFTRVSAPVWFDTPQYAGFLDNLDSGVPWGTDYSNAGDIFQFARNQAWSEDANPGFGGSYTDRAGKAVAGNTFDFASVHGRAILDAGYAVESSSASAFDGSSEAFAADVICGKQLTTVVGRGAVPNRYPVFPDGLQAALRRYTSSGGNVVISGSYIGTDAWDAVFPGVPKASDATRSFVTDVLGYQWVTNFGDHGGKVTGTRGSGLPEVSYNRDWSPDYYRVESPDGIKPASSKASILMRYKDGSVPAAVWFESPAGYKVASFGFPLETSPELPELMDAVLKKF
ncbi:MAG: xanthan lyase [Bacteroidales bacterium]|nr:xanthan lyase [Bacteroidales bacterium]